MRDKLIHEYHNVDIEIVWEVIKSEIPPLKSKFNNALKEMVASQVPARKRKDLEHAFAAKLILAQWLEIRHVP